MVVKDGPKWLQDLITAARLSRSLFLLRLTLTNCRDGGIKATLPQNRQNKIRKGVECRKRVALLAILPEPRFLLIKSDRAAHGVG